jgi:hypothetical protein
VHEQVGVLRSRAPADPLEHDAGPVRAEHRGGRRQPARSLRAVDDGARCTEHEPSGGVLTQGAEQASPSQEDRLRRRLLHREQRPEVTTGADGSLEHGAGERHVRRCPPGTGESHVREVNI